MSKKLRVAILFGGKSAEHEVSLQSAKNIVAALDSIKYEAVLIGIDTTGAWVIPEQARFLLNGDDPKRVALNTRNTRSVALIPQSRGDVTTFSSQQPTNSAQQWPTSTKIDVVFPVLHGPFGEDGTIQGLLKLADVPFVGPSVLGSAVGMDKDVMKRLLRDAGILVAQFLVHRAHEEPLDFTAVVDKLGLPFFVKPANLGSSVGVHKITNMQEYSEAMTDAFQYDSKILLEEYIEGREIECAVLGNEDRRASVPGEVVPLHEFYSYEAKYIDEHGVQLKIPADIPDETKEKIQELAIQSCKVLECEGMGRVDFFLKKDGEVLVNEINTTPGFTSVSMYPQLWQASGVSQTELIDTLIQLSIDRFKREKKLKVSYNALHEA